MNQRIGRAQRTIDPRIAKVAADVIVPHERLADLFGAMCDAEFRSRTCRCGVGTYLRREPASECVPRRFDEYVAGAGQCCRLAAPQWLGRQPLRRGTASDGTR